jgi:hypothetical protein
VLANHHPILVTDILVDVNFLADRNCPTDKSNKQLATNVVGGG